MLHIKLAEIVLHIGTLRIAVGGTGALHHGQIGPSDEGLDILFPCADEGTDHGDILPCHLRDGGIAAESALKEQIHHKGLYRVIVVMTQSKLVQPPVKQQL